MPDDAESRSYRTVKLDLSDNLYSLTETRLTMSIARHHAEWLSLVPVSGPFLSLPVLMEAFTAGLEPHDPEHSRLLRQEYEKCGGDGEAAGRPGTASAVDQVRPERDARPGRPDARRGAGDPPDAQVEVPEHHELLRPSLVVVEPGDEEAPAAGADLPAGRRNLTSYVAGLAVEGVAGHPDDGTAPRHRRAAGAGHQRRALDAGGCPEGGDDRVSPRGTRTSGWRSRSRCGRSAACSAADRFFGVADDETLEAMLKKSAANQQEVTDQLGYQVRRAVEVLIQSLDRADQDSGGSCWPGCPRRSSTRRP